jgi:RNA polymerase-associated protein RTF1
MEKPGGRSFICDIMARCAHGKAEKAWPLITCSNDRITSFEYDRYARVCNEEGISLPTKKRLEDKYADMKGLINRQWTDEEIREKLARSGAIHAKEAPALRARLKRRIEEAKALGDMKLVEELEGEMKQYQVPTKLAFGTSLGGHKSTSSPRPAAPTKPKEKTEAEIRAQTQKELAKISQVSSTPKPLLKRKIMKSANGSALGSGAGTPTGSQQQIKEEKKDEIAPLIAKLQKERLLNGKGPLLAPPISEDDILANIDMGIDIEI